MNSNRNRMLLGLGGILVLFLLHALYYNGLVDDAFISFRYARNLAGGNGLVFNIGDRVEGYTNFLWVLMLSGLMKLGCDPLVWSRVLGVLAGAAILCMLFLFARRRWPDRPAVALAAPLLLASNRTFCVWCVAGLETSFFSALCLAGVLLADCGGAGAEGGAIRPAEGGGGRGRSESLWPLLSGFLLGCAALARPEGAIVFVCLALVLAIDERRRLILTALPFAILAGSHLAFRVSYYGHWLPNTFAVKVNGLYPVPGLVQTALFARDNLLGIETIAILLAVPAAMALIRRERAQPRTSRAIPAALLAALLYLVYIVCVGGDSYEYRFYHPVLVLLMLPFSYGIALGLELFDASGIEPRPGAVRIAPALLVLIAAKGLVTSAAGFQVVDRTVDFGFGPSTVSISSIEYAHQVCEVWSQAGQWIGANADSNETIALGAVGAIPWYSRLRTIDILGLIEAEGASFPPAGKRIVGHERRADPNWVMGRHPTYYCAFPNPIRLTGPDPVREVTVRLPAGAKFHFQSVSNGSKIKPGEYSFPGVP